MQLLHESTVQDEEIDSLGHMNVRYYMARMEQANRTLIDSLDMPAETMAAGFLRRVDTYTRFRREQFAGAPLHTVGGVLALAEGGMQSYVEVRNADSQDVAATFIVTTALIEQASRRPLPFPAAGTFTPTEVPAYAKPRSLTLGPVNTAVTLDQLDATIPAVEGGGMMSGKRNTTIEDDDVDAEGWLKEELELMFLPFAKLAQQEDSPQGPPVFQTGDGRRVGWAIMETRNLLYGQPRLNDEIAYFSADLRLEEKSRLSRRWAFNANSGQLLGISDSVGLCIDLDARRAITWPAELRAQIERYQQPQLA